ncbi:MAG: glycosyltransferase family 39 protein [bacterium]
MPIASLLVRASRSRRAPWLIALAALSMRMVLGVGLLNPRAAPIGDEVIYAELAQNIQEAGVLGLTPDNPTAHRMPGYPFWIAGIQSLTGSTLLAPRMAQAVVGSTTPVAIFLLTRLLFGAGAALIAAVLAVIDPFLIFYDWHLWAETTTIALATWTVYYAVRNVDRLEARRGAVLGLLCGATVYFRPDAITLGPALVAWFAFRIRPWKRWLEVAASAGLVTELLLVPWQIRNYRMTGHFVPLTTEAGYILWQTNNVESMHNSGIKGFWYPWPGHPEANDYAAYLEGPDLKSDPRFAGLTNEVDLDRRCKELVREFWWEHRAEMPTYVLLKWARFFALSPSFSFWNPIFVWVSRLWYGGVLTAFVIGLGIAARRKLPIGVYLWLLAAFFVKAAIVHVNFRYRLQVEAILLSLAGLTTFTVLEWLSSRRIVVASRPAAPPS